MIKRYFATAAFALMISSAPAAFAQSSDMLDYTTYMNEGMKFYNAENEDGSQYIKAIEQFMMASKLSDNPDPYLYIARSYLAVSDCNNALRSFRDYKKKAENRRGYIIDDDVDEQIKSLNDQCGIQQGELAATCSPANTFMKIDNGEPVPCSEVVPLAVGMHSVVFVLDGYKSIARSVTLKKDERITFEVTMSTERSNAKVASTLSLEEAKKEDERRAANASISAEYFEGDTPLLDHGFLWGGLGASVVGIALTITGGFVFDSAYTKDVGRKGYECDDSKKSAGIAVFSIGAAAAVAGVALMIYDAFDQRKTESKRYDQIREQIVMRPTFALGQDAAAAGVAVTF